MRATPKGKDLLSKAKGKKIFSCQVFPDSPSAKITKDHKELTNLSHGLSQELHEDEACY